MLCREARDRNRRLFMKHKIAIPTPALVVLVHEPRQIDGGAVRHHDPASESEPSKLRRLAPDSCSKSVKETEGAFKCMLSARKGRSLVRRQSRLRKLLVREVEHATPLAGGRKAYEENYCRNWICCQSGTIRTLCNRVWKHMGQVKQNGYGG